MTMYFNADCKYWTSINLCQFKDNKLQVYVKIHNVLIHPYNGGELECIILPFDFVE